MKPWRALWSELPIKKKLLLFFFVMIFCISALNLYTITNAFRYLDMFEQELLRNSEVYQLQFMLSDNYHSFEEYLKEKENNTQMAFSPLPGEIWNRWTLINRHSRTTPEAGFQINALRYGILAYIESNNRVLELDKRGENYIEELSRFRRLYGYLENYLESLVQIRLNEGIALHSSHIRIINRVQTISVLGIIIIASSFLLFGVVFSESLTRPLRELAANSRIMAAGKLDVRKTFYRNRDEIGVLVDSFYTMSGNIHNMVESLQEKREMERKLHEDELEMIKMKKSLREARFLNLQSQINPHFLFNTLNTISRMSLFEGAPKSVRLIESLATVFRHSLESTSPIVTLIEEIEILKEYIHIQETRFGDRLQFVTECAASVEQTELPVFTLQPLVENAIKHGIEPKEEGGLLRICAYGEGDAVIITVEDSGVGMPAETLKRLNGSNGHDEGEPLSGIGVVNVRKRLSLAYGEQSRFMVTKRIGGGTLITIELPREYKCIEF